MRPRFTVRCRRCGADHTGHISSGMGAVAGLARQARAGRIGRDDVVMVNLTGRDRDPEPARRTAQRLTRTAAGWALDGIPVERAVA